MTTRRVFIALDVSDEARKVCTAHIDRLRLEFPDVRVNWERSEKLHITVKFLGDMDVATLEKLGAATSDIGRRHSPFRLHLDRAGVFPSKQRPRILWIGLDGASESISTLHSDIEDACRDLGFKDDGRRFRPHVTIGRIRDSLSALRLCEAHTRTTIEPVEFSVGEVVIYESKLQPSGSIYSPVCRASIGVEGTRNDAT